MRNAKLSTKILIASAFILVIFGLASFGILFRALSKQSTEEMDQLLKSETLSLSALANSTQSGGFDFEIPSQFLLQYRQRNPDGFFKFIDPQSGMTLKQSEGAPDISCPKSDTNFTTKISEETFRIESHLFYPAPDNETRLGNNGRMLCLVAGINRAPFRKVLIETLLSSLPALLLIMILLIGMMLMLIRGLTRDLSALSSALVTANFEATHSFPTLPRAETQEVKAIVEKLEDLHRQASAVYRDMWLFLGRAAHQLKTPVAAMQATLEVLLRKDRSKDELLVGLEDVKSATLLLGTLTKKLISSSRISYQESSITEIIHLDSFFKSLLKVLKSLAEQNNIRLVLSSPSPAVTVIGNQSLMIDIFGNLIENAILYSANKSVSDVVVSYEVVDKKAVIEIADRGPGFPAQVQSEIFQPFVRGDERNVSGSGLGLSIAKKSAVLLNGQIELTESSERGSRLRVMLPLAKS